MDGKIDWKPIWWTTIIVAITSIVIGGILRLIERNLINKAAYAQTQGYFLTEQPDYFPLLFLVVMLIVTFFVVWVYRMILPNLPANWIYRGLLIGAFLFIVGDLPNAMMTGYTTIIPPAAAQGMAVSDLLNRLINGCILTYCYFRFSFEYQKGKADKTVVQTKGPRL